MAKNGWENPKSAENGKLGGRPIASATWIKQKFREALAKEIEADSKEWIGAIKASALGHYVEVKRPDGSVKVYKKSPDPSAWQKGMDRAFGSPEQTVDLSTLGQSLNGYENLPEEAKAKMRAIYEEEMKIKTLKG